MVDRLDILVAGGSGFIGRALCEQLSTLGYRVWVLSRKSQKTRQSMPFVNTLNWTQLHTTSQRFLAIINLAGESIAGGRWTPRYQERLVTSRLQTTLELVSFCQNTISPPAVFINASAIGFYGDHGCEVITEQSATRDCFSHRLCAQWEESLKPLRETSNIRMCIARFGVVLAPKGGAFPTMALPFKLKLALQNGDGQQWFSWVALSDAVRAVIWLLENDSATGAYNVCSPQPIKNVDFVKQLRLRYDARFSWKIPENFLRLVLGEMAEELLLASQRVVPDRLLEEGFKFNHIALDELLASWR
jgi:uncharacterized protein (TIGR01777 family)